MIELTKEQLAMVIMDLKVSTDGEPVTNKTYELIDFLYKAYADDRRICTIGIIE